MLPISLNSKCWCAFLTASFLLVPLVKGQDSFSWIEKGLEHKGQRNRAASIEAFEKAVSTARAEGDDYHLYFALRDLSSVYYQLPPRQIDERIEYLEQALVVVDRILANRSKGHQILPIEKILSLGYLEAAYQDRFELAQSFKIHQQTLKALEAYIQSRGEPDYDLESGIPPRSLDKRWRSLVPRNLWRRAWHLERQGRTGEALRILAVAERYLENLSKPLNLVETDYYFKVRDAKINLIDFLGEAAEALRLAEETLADPRLEKHQYSWSVATVNYNRNLSQYYGPKESYLRAAMEAERVYYQTTRAGQVYRPGKVVLKMAGALRLGGGSLKPFEDLVADQLDRDETFEAAYSQRDLLVFKTQNGDLDGVEEGFIELLRVFQKEGNLKGLPSLFRAYGDLLVRLGRYEEAVVMLRRAAEMTEANGWDLHLPRLWIKLAAVHEILGDRRSADALWARIDQWEADHPVAPRERIIEIMTGRLARLRRHGDRAEYDRLAEVYETAIGEMGLPEYLATGFRRELAMPFEIDDPKFTAAPDGEDRSRAILDPLVVTSEVLPGETARARFTLANPGKEVITGKLRVPGTASASQWDAANGVLKSEITEAGRSLKFLQPIELQPFDLIEVFLSDARPGGDFSGLKLAWVDADESEIETAWTYSASDVSSQVSVSQASLARRNPFMAVLFYHEVLRRKDAPGRLDFRVVSDEELHIEIADAETGQVLAVDHQADGSFSETGDIILDDENVDGFPDLSLLTEPERRALELRVYPAKAGPEDENAKGDDITVELQFRVGDEWQTLSENRLTH